MNNSAIGVFDSGVGGLTCVGELRRIMPCENIVYLGDTARVPYGTKSRDTIAHYARQDIRFLERHDVKMVLVACGTVSSVMMTVPIFEGSSVRAFGGVIEPAVEAACKATRNCRIGVIGTPATIRSECYADAIKKIRPDIRVTAKACPMFVPLVENGYTSPQDKVSRLIAEEYLEVMREEQVDTLILGCTHYPMLEAVIGEVMGEGVTLISSGREAARAARDALEKADALTDRREKGALELYCTDSEELFAENAAAFLGKVDMSISKCSLTI